MSGIARVNPIPELVKGSRTPYRKYTREWEFLTPQSRNRDFERQIADRYGVYTRNVRVFRALGSGHNWTGVAIWQDTEHEDYTMYNLVVTLQPGKSWSVCENKVLRWLARPSEEARYEETGAGSVDFLRWVLEQVKDYIEAWKAKMARAAGPYATKPIRVKVGWGDPKRERAYAYLTRFGFRKVADAGDGDPAYILDIQKEAKENPYKAAIPLVSGIAYIPNPMPMPGAPIEVTTRSERIGTLGRDLAPGVRMISQISRTEKEVWVTHGEERLFVYLKDDQGRGSYFYQSFAGTGGKSQGTWFPSGGVLADRSGRGLWVIKGNPKTDPGAGREGLLAFYEKANAVLPQSDADTHLFVKKMTGVGLDEDFTYKDEYEIKATLRLMDSGAPRDLQAKWGGWAYQFWALNALDKTWGKRSFNFKTNPVRAPARRNGGKTYADLMEELRWLGPGVVAEMIMGRTLVACEVFASNIARYLIERGFETKSMNPRSREGHYASGAYTTDRGWVGLDATEMQFRAPYTEHEAGKMGALKEYGLDIDEYRSLPQAKKDELIQKYFEPVIQWSVQGLLDGTKAFDIVATDDHSPAGHRAYEMRTVFESTSAVDRDPTWRSYWSKARRWAEDLTKPDMGAWVFTRNSYWAEEVSRRVQGKRISGSDMKSNPADLAGRHIPERYLAGLPPKLQKQRIRELTESRDAYHQGDFSELPTDVTARKMGLVKESSYTTVAKRRGIEWKGNAADMANRVLTYYGVRSTPALRTALTEALNASFKKGLAAWKSGGHRPGATAQNWAVARVNSLVVGGKTAWTADRKQFLVLPPSAQDRVIKEMPQVLKALQAQGRQKDVDFLKSVLTRENPLTSKETQEFISKYPMNKGRPLGVWLAESMMGSSSGVVRTSGSAAKREQQARLEMAAEGGARAAEYLFKVLDEDEISELMRLDEDERTEDLDYERQARAKELREKLREVIYAAKSAGVAAIRSQGRKEELGQVMDPRTGAAAARFAAQQAAAKRSLARMRAYFPNEPDTQETDENIARTLEMTVEEYNEKKATYQKPRYSAYESERTELLGTTTREEELAPVVRELELDERIAATRLAVEVLIKQEYPYAPGTPPPAEAVALRMLPEYLSMQMEPGAAYRAASEDSGLRRSAVRELYAEVGSIAQRFLDRPKEAARIAERLSLPAIEGPKLLTNKGRRR